MGIGKHLQWSSVDESRKPQPAVHWYQSKSPPNSCSGPGNNLSNRLQVYGRCYQRPQPFNDAKSSQMFDQATIDAGRGVCADNAALNEVGGAEQWIKFVEELRPHLPSV